MKIFIIFALLTVSLTGKSQILDENNLGCTKSLYYNYNLQSNKNVGKNYNIFYLRAFWDINPNYNFIKGSITYYFYVNEAFSVINFDLHDTLNVDSIIYHNSTVLYSRNNNIIDIDLNTSLNTGSTDSITLYYNGTPTKIDAYRGTFWTKKYEYNGDSIPCMWTLSEPYGAKDWFPCKQELNEKIDSCDLFFQTPAKYKTAANGLLISEDTLNAKRISHWKTTYPTSTYLIGFVTSEFNENHRYIHLLNNDSIYIMEYSLKNNTSIVTNPYTKLADLFNLYDTLFMEYPFKNEKYGHMQWFRPGGMEHQTMSSMDGFSNNNHLTIEHELSHQWFGNYVTCGSWSDIWLNEGFATFCNFLSLEYLWNETYLNNLLKSYLEQIVSSPDGSVYVTDTLNVKRVFDGRLSYAKGGYLLRMLRWELGDTKFFNGMRAYISTPKLKNNFARVTDFVEAMEQICDTSLTEFFNDWYYGEGHPIYNIEYQQNDDKYLNILVSQNSSNQSVSFFEMTIPIQFWSNGNDTIIKFHNNTNNQLYGVQFNSIIDSVIFDPKLQLVSQNVVTQGFVDIEKIKKINVYPNPAKNKLFIEYILPTNIGINIIGIYNINGKLVKTIEIQNQFGTKEIDVSGLQSGSYIVKFGVNETATVSKKFIIDK